MRLRGERCTFGAAIGPACGRAAAWRFHPDALDDPPLGPAVTAFLLRVRVCELHRGPALIFADGMSLWIRV